MENDRESIISLDSSKKFQEFIEDVIDFLDLLSLNIFSTGSPHFTVIGSRTHLLDCRLISSAIKSLNSICKLCLDGSFADANMLARKYRDDLLLYLYISEVLSKRKLFSEEDLKEFDLSNMSEQLFVEFISKAMTNSADISMRTDNDLCVDAWLESKVQSLPPSYRKKLSFSNYMDYLQQNIDVTNVIEKHGLQKVWKNISKRLNDYTHNNGIEHTNHNLLTAESKEIDACFESISGNLSFITSFFLIILILIEPNIIMSSDYIAHMESGLTPPEDSQYWVAPFINDYINKHINPIHPELKLFLRDNNKFGMKIE